MHKGVRSRAEMTHTHTPCYLNACQRIAGTILFLVVTFLAITTSLSPHFASNTICSVLYTHTHTNNNIKKKKKEKKSALYLSNGKLFMTE